VPPFGELTEKPPMLRVAIGPPGCSSAEPDPSDERMSFPQRNIKPEPTTQPTRTSSVAAYTLRERSERCNLGSIYTLHPIWRCVVVEATTEPSSDAYEIGLKIQHRRACPACRRYRTIQATLNHLHRRQYRRYARIHRTIERQRSQPSAAAIGQSGWLRIVLVKQQETFELQAPPLFHQA